MGRMLLGFLVGLIGGFLITTYFFYHGGGDFLISTSPRMQQLEHALTRATEEQERTAKKLEDAATIIEQLNARYTKLEQQLHALASQPPSSQPITPPPAEMETPQGSSTQTPHGVSP